MGFVGEGRGMSRTLISCVCVCVCVSVFSGLRSAEIWGVRSARQLAGSWILSGVHQGS